MSDGVVTYFSIFLSHKNKLFNIFNISVWMQGRGARMGEEEYTRPTPNLQPLGVGQDGSLWVIYPYSKQNVQKKGAKTNYSIRGSH